MLDRFRPRSAYDVMAAIAFFIAVTGAGAYAAAKIGSSNIKKNAVHSRHIKNGQVERPDLANGVIDASKVKANSLGGGQVNEAGLDSTALRTRAAQGGCAPTVAGTGPMVKVGPSCVDKSEDSVWSKPNGGVQYGVNGDDYPCADTGRNCSNIYARSVPGVKPSADITWFQAQQALVNSGKRLPTNAEWQAAAAGTPDSADTCIRTAAANANTGSDSGCVSRFGAYDMVGNVEEWVADWVPASGDGSCPGWNVSDDLMCLAGADATKLGPAALIRGSRWSFSGGPHTEDGPLAVDGRVSPDLSDSRRGFRGARGG